MLQPNACGLRKRRQILLMEGAMAVLADFPYQRSDTPLAAGTLPWQGVALLLCMAILLVVAAVLYPAVFATPVQQF
jgi:hypothetical protein